MTTPLPEPYDTMTALNLMRDLVFRALDEVGTDGYLDGATVVGIGMTAIRIERLAKQDWAAKLPLPAPRPSE